MPQPPCIVAIVGGSGAGKTWLADQLQAVFAEKCARLCLDDFYRDRSHLSRGRRARLNFDHPRAIDWPQVEAVLNRCVGGKPIRVPRYNFAEHRTVPEGAWWQPKPLLLFEGLWLLHRPALRRLFALSIFLDCAEDVRFRRRVQRDVEERSRTAESVREQFQRMVVPMHERYVAPQARWADISLRGILSGEDVEELAQQVRRVLSEKRVSTDETVE